MNTWVVLTIFLATPCLSLAADIYVPDDYSTIQEAIDAAVDGDAVIVRPGTYYEKVQFRGKAVSLRSELGPYRTFIDNPGPSSSVQFMEGEGRDSVIEGFTIQNGKGTKDGHTTYGGGVFCKKSSPTIRNNIIRNNDCTGGGGGIGCRRTGDPLIHGNLILYNESAGTGGGVFFSGGEMKDNVISKNRSWSFGGGIFCDGVNPLHLMIKGNVITDNIGESGGGVSVIRHSDRVISENFIAGNCAVVGGGIYLYSNASPTITNNIVRENESLRGGGIACEYDCSPCLSNNIIDHNLADYGGGIYSTGNPDFEVLHCTLTNNSAQITGGGLCFMQGCTGAVVNSILWGDSGTSGPEIYLGNANHPSTLTLRYSDIAGGQSGIAVDPGSSFDWGPGMIDADPLFLDPSSGDFHIPFDSPCRSAGDRYAQYLPDSDFEGDPRTGLFVFPDIGADEFHTHFYVNGSVSIGSNATGVIIGWPRTNPVMLISGVNGGVKV